ncbi:MAG: DUF4352 domain-containing protein, partial [Bifidobacteriaceae bacterium]|nr:DUF4352 domain-containing protein [Bifidobacteriaceae bacterium]
ESVGQLTATAWPTAPTSGGEPTASGITAPTADNEPGDQWHHKASTALGFRRPRHHLTKRETAGAIVLAALVLVGIAAAVLALTGNLPGGRSQTHDSPAQADASDLGAGAAATTPGRNNPNTDGEPDPGATGATEWSLGQSFTAGDFLLALDSYEGDLPQLADPGQEVAENGRWVLVGITVKNAGDEDGTFLPDQQVLVTEKGDRYANEPASALKHAEFTLGINPIKPGGSQSGFLAFDIPLGDRPVALELVGRIGEPAVTVPLG